MSRLHRSCYAVLLCVLASMTLATPAFAQVIVEYEYEPDRIYEVRTGLGITTQIELSQSEEILDYSTGFNSGWELNRRENVFYLKPKNVDVDTNMMVRTATHSYLFELKVVATDWTALEQAKRAGVHYKITFSYPNNTAFSAEQLAASKAGNAPKPRTSEIETSLDKDRAYYFDYSYSTRTKNKWLVPVNVYDDGQFTYINLANINRFPTGDFPAVYGREREGGEDFLVNTTVEDSTLVVHGTYPFLVIRHGKNVVGLRRNKQKVNQNLPPNPPGQSGNYSDNQGSNPYYSAQQSQDQPDLDAGAPQLKSVDSQRVNRKALMFLAGIVALLVLMTIIVIKNASSDKEEAVEKPREEKVVIPELPKGTNTAGSPDFAELQQEPQPVPIQELPPLPPEEPTRAAQNRTGPRDDYRDPPAPAGPQGPTLAERRMGAGGEGGGRISGAGGPPGQDQNAQVLDAMLDNLRSAQQQANGGAPQAAAGQARDTATKVSIAQYLRNPDTLLVRGTYIRCVLETRIVTDYPGYTSCIVTEPVYSINGRKLLLPKGSKALGRYQGEPTGPRVAVIWDRITTPNGLDVTLEGPGVDNLGGSGHPGDYNGHWFSKLSSALMISLISDVFKYYAATEGPATDSVTTGGNIVTQPFESNTAKTTERLANQVLSKSLARPATVTINQGTVLNIYVAGDVDFSGVVARR